MSSTSAAGVSIITLQFDLGLALDVAEQEVQAAINAGGSLLPADLPAPPVYAKVNPADAPVLTLAISSDTHAADRRAEPRQHAAGAEDQPGLRRRAWCRSSAASGRRCASRPTRRRWRRTASAWTRCARAIAAANANAAKGSFDGPDARLHDQFQRPAADGRRLPRT